MSGTTTHIDHEANGRAAKAMHLVAWLRTHGITSDMAEVASEERIADIAQLAKVKMPSVKTWDMVIHCLADVERKQPVDPFAGL